MGRWEDPQGHSTSASLVNAMQPSLDTEGACLSLRIKQLLSYEVILNYRLLLVYCRPALSSGRTPCR